jgi:pyruvate/2-oxoacid:ferredoxin oxidoreductase alpha subunit
MVLPDKYDSSRFYSMIETIYAAAMRRLSIVLVACALSVPAR